MNLNSFLTLEDINTTIFSNQGYYWCHLDLDKISKAGSFSETTYDFIKVTKTHENGGYYFKLKINNSNWTKGFCSSASDEVVTEEGFDLVLKSYYSTDKHIYLYMGNSKFEDITRIGYLLKEDNISLNYKEINTSQEIVFKNRYGINWLSLTADVDVGYNLIKRSNNDIVGYLLVKLLKSDFQFQCNQTLTVGKVNKVYLGTNADYKPSGDMVGDYTTNISVDYNGTILPVSYDGTDYYFNLDLTDKTTASKVKFKVIVESNEVLNASETEVVLNSDYQTVSTFDSLLAACTANGIDIIRLGGNLTATADIPVKHSIKIIGNNKTIDLDGHKFILDKDVSFNAENIQFNNGDTTIIQQSNTKVELTSCTFQNCTSTNYNGLGSCIFCDVDIDSLDISNDYITTLTDCLFTNNQSCILHGGELLIDNCRLHNTDLTYINTNNVAFLYQTDGAAVIQNSIFDIDYTDTTLCTNETNIGFAQCLLQCGETANINGSTYVELGNNDTLQLFDAPYNNRSHIFCKYYYPQITACVFTSPVAGKEDKSCCHTVSGVDWVFKNNAKVTNASAGTENTTRKITW